MSIGNKRVLQSGVLAALGVSALLLSSDIASAYWCNWTVGGWGDNQVNCTCTVGGGVMSDIGAPPNTVHTLVVNTYAGANPAASTDGIAWRPNGSFIQGHDDGVNDDSWTHNEAVDWTVLGCRNDNGLPF